MNFSALQKLEWAFKLGATDREACNEAGISQQTLYNYQAKNGDFLEQKELWKSTSVFKARKAVVDRLEADPYLSLKYLEKKLPSEFGNKTELAIKKQPTIDVVALVRDIEERNARLRA